MTGTLQRCVHAAPGMLVHHHHRCCCGCYCESKPTIHSQLFQPASMQAHQVDARCGAGSAVHRLADTDWLAQTRGKDYLAEIIGGEGPRQATDEELQWIILLHGETECSARSLQGSTL